MAMTNDENNGPRFQGSVRGIGGEPNPDATSEEGIEVSPGDEARKSLDRSVAACGDGEQCCSSCGCSSPPSAACPTGTCGFGRFLFALCFLASLALNGYLAYQLRFERLVNREQAARSWLKEQRHVLLVPEPSTRAITSVHFQNRDVDDVVLGRTGELFRLSSIHLGETNITDEQLKHVSGLSHLASLVLSDTGISDKGLPHLSRLGNLQNLYLPGTKVTNEGLKTLAKLPKLAVLDVSNTAVNGDGLANLANVSTLQWLLISGNDITDESLEHLKSLPGLKRLTINNTAVTEKGKTALLKANPNLAIDHSMNVDPPKDESPDSDETSAGPSSEDDAAVHSDGDERGAEAPAEEKPRD